MSNTSEMYLLNPDPFERIRLALDKIKKSVIVSRTFPSSFVGVLLNSPK